MTYPRSIRLGLMPERVNDLVLLNVINLRLGPDTLNGLLSEGSRVSLGGWRVVHVIEAGVVGEGVVVVDALEEVEVGKHHLRVDAALEHDNVRVVDQRGRRRRQHPRQWHLRRRRLSRAHQWVRRQWRGSDNRHGNEREWDSYKTRHGCGQKARSGFHPPASSACTWSRSHLACHWETASICRSGSCHCTSNHPTGYNRIDNHARQSCNSQSEKRQLEYLLVIQSFISGPQSPRPHPHSRSQSPPPRASTVSLLHLA